MEQWSGTECARNPGKPGPSLAAVRQAERGERPDKKNQIKTAVSVSCSVSLKRLGGFNIIFSYYE